MRTEIVRGRRLAILTGLLALAMVGVTVYLGWPHLRFWDLFESLGMNAQGYPEYRHRQTGIVMVKLPGGKFWMGAQKDDPNGRNYDPDAQVDEGPVHEVTLSPFLIGKYEVTQGQWRKVIVSMSSDFAGDEDNPVRVSWDEIQEFETKTRLNLPTEAQWEYSCRGGAAISFARKIEDLAWFAKNSGNSVHRVGTKEPNGFGLHDVQGNIAEWCEEVYDPGIYGRTDATSPYPDSERTSPRRVCRGGSSDLDARRCRSSSRSANHYLECIHGFRPVSPWSTP